MFVFGKELETGTLMDPRRVVQDVEKPMSKHFENLFEKEKDRLVLVETIRNELRKTEKEEEIPREDKDNCLDT